MEFASANGIKRPVRCSEQTRAFARESMDRKYGLESRKTPFVCVTVPENATAYERYDAAIRKIAEEAPVRICENELISGAATLGGAIEHKPAQINGVFPYLGLSHLTVDFYTAVFCGLNKVRADMRDSYEKHRGTEREPFLKSCLNTLESFDIWRRRYLERLKDLPGYEKNYQNLCRVPNEPARSFHEAVQSLWFCFAFLRLCGNWPGIGRIDEILGGFLKNDLENGVLTLSAAREILAHFFIKGCEWVCGGDYGSGDAQHYQNIVLAGVDSNGSEVMNEVTYLVLDVIEEFGISDFPTTVRLNKNTDPKLLERVAEVMRFGGGVLAVYNEDLIIDSLVRYGYALTEARKFANDGCWEVQIPGKTYFSYVPRDFLGLLQHSTLRGYAPGTDFADFDSLYNAYLGDVKGLLESILAETNGQFASRDPWVWRKQAPCTAVSLFEQGCVEKGLSYLEGGPVYNVISPHLGGLADVVNSLFAIKKLVYDDKKVSFPDLMTILRADWEGAEPLRQYALNKYVYYGNDSDEVDALCQRLISDYADLCDSLNGRSGYVFPGGVSTFGRQLEWSHNRLACPYGRKKGEILAPNASPTPGTDTLGATAIIRSYCKNDLAKLPVGAALDIKLLPSAALGEDGVNALVALMRGFVELGGFFMQPDVADAAVLRAAQEHPEDHLTLSVRVSGWNARFVTLNKEWQDMVIEQNECGCGY